MKIKYRNNFNKGESYTDGLRQEWNYRPELNQPDTPGKRFAYEMDASTEFQGHSAEETARREAERFEDGLRRKEKEKWLRRNIYRRLRKMGFERDHKSDSGSVYYTGLYKGEFVRMRVSNHEIPMTEQRMHERANGGFSCCDREIIIEL